MRTKKEVRMFDDILFKAAQLFRFPLLPKEKVNMKTIIGKTAKNPLEISMPIFISHMSFGALSKEAKTALAKGSAKMDTVMCSGEGGSHPDEFKNANKYIYEISAAKFTYNKEWIKRADAVEIKIGQSAKPGLGGHLPKEKITDEIAKLRGISKDEDLISPARYENISSKEDLKNFVIDLRKINGGKPVGIKFAAGHVEKDLEIALHANPDFITIDGRGGGTGAAPTFIKDNFSMPIVYGISRARRYLDKQKSKITLIVTGGFRTSGEIVKAISMGADVVAIATSAMIAIGCEQYRACNTGECPVGIATQKQNLRNRFNVEESTNRLVNYLETLNHELVEITQAIGKNDIHKLNYDDIFTTSKEISDYTDVEHA